MKKLLIIVILLLSHTLFSQKEANFWYFGANAGITFNSGSPTALVDGKLFTTEGCASISDSDGNLLFYTNGITIWNKQHIPMPNGSGLLGDFSSTQSGIIVPHPDNNGLFYVFTVDDLGEENGLRYSIVDINLNGGLGDVTSDKNILLHTPSTEKITAVRHANGNDIWVVAHKFNTNEFTSYLINSSGLNINPVISSIGYFPISIYDAIGYLKLSPNGSKLAIVYGQTEILEIFDFDNSTGIISNPIQISSFTSGNPSSRVYGVEFSPNNNLLYVSESEDGIYQFDITNFNQVDIENSKTHILPDFTPDIKELHQALQLGPDGKIYVAHYDYDFLGVINNPDIKGNGCNYEFDGVYLEGKKSLIGLPPFIQSYFSISNVTYINTCFEDTTEFILNNTVDSVIWDFGDPVSGVNNTSTGSNPTHVFTAPGTYTVTTTATLGTETSTITTEVTIYKTPSASQPTDIIVCDDDNDGFYNFNLTNQTNTILNGQSISEFEVNYYASMKDYTNNTKISDYSSYQNMSSYQEQTIVARVTNKQKSDCEAITSFKINVFESPTPALSASIPNLSYCDNTSVGTDIDGRIKFNLKDRETTILNGQSTTDFEVSYFTDAAYTMQIPTSDVTDFENTSNPQTIYVRVTNRNNGTCVGDTSFMLEVFELPTVVPVVSLRQCDNDIDGFSFFNLTEVNEELITNSSRYTITYHETQALAESGNAAITNFTAYENETVSTDTVWARIENANGCHRTSQINLFVSTTQIPLTYTREFYECDDGINTSDGIATFDFSQITNEIESIFPAGQQLIIKYYQSEAEALAEQNPIPDADISNYQNTASPSQQNIYIRVDSAVDNDCLGLGHHITLNVEKVPVANPVNIDPECDNDRDSVFAFDTSTIQSTLIGTQTNVTVSYTDESGAVLPSPLPNPFSTGSQTITARITNNTSQDPDGQCYAETTINFVVNNVPIAKPIAPLEQCDDDTDGIVAFDTSEVENTILGTQTGMVVKYFDENGVVLPSPLPNPFYTASQTITVRIENPLYAICFEETNVEFIVREKPNFELEKEAIICLTNNSSLDITAQNPTGNYSYEWKDGNGDIISNDIIANVSKGGIYSVKATSDFGCESDIKNIEVKESSISNITTDNLEIIDDSDNNSIRINTQNIGLGNYEFSLLNSDSNIIYDYQTTPFFDDLEGGIYTILIKDINGCGIQSFETSIISYPKFFTPNNDGINDTWHIKGIGKSFYKSGVVQIFDRYGKLIKNLSLNDNGWNGFYNGQNLPSNDYWFYAELIDPKGNVIKKRGNFSLLRK